MKRHWLLFALVALALVLVGCAEEKKPEVMEKPGALAMDPSILPAPRPAIQAAPDLSGASLVVNDATLAKMSADAVPSNVTDALASLKGREFTNAAEFEAAVKGAVGDGADAYMDRIMRNALVVNMAEEALMPGEAPPVPPGEMMAVEFGTVYFDFDKSNIKPEFEATIKANAEKLMASPDLKVIIEGHCDERGTNEYNLALGQRRAESVRRSLVAAGVSESQLSTVSYGEERPVALGHNEEAWAKNRRSVLTAQ